MKKVKRILSLMVIIILAIGVVGCSKQTQQQVYENDSEDTATENEESLGEVAEYRKITAQEAKEKMDNETVVILDVRTQEEYDTSHLDKAVLIPVDTLEVLAPESLKDKKATILVYCRSGNRSKTAANILVDLGYTNVYDFGGINDWPYETVQ